MRANRPIAWSLAYLGLATSLIAVLGAIGPGFAIDILGLRPQDFFFVMGPAGLGVVVGILFLNAYGRDFPRRLVIDGALVAMGVTIIGLALVKPITVWLSPALQPIEHGLPEALSPIISLIALVVVIAIFAGVEYAFVAIPAQTALQEDLPVEVRGRIFGILNTLLSVASFLPVIVRAGRRRPPQPLPPRRRDPGGDGDPRAHRALAGDRLVPAQLGLRAAPGPAGRPRQHRNPCRGMTTRILAAAHPARLGAHRLAGDHLRARRARAPGGDRDLAGVRRLPRPARLPGHARRARRAR